MKFHYRFPSMEEFDLESGLKVVCIPDREQHGFVVALQLPFGRFSDPAGREGLCELTIGLLSKGTQSFSSEEIAEKLEHAGATFFTDIGEEHSVIGIRLLASALTELLPLFMEMLRAPRFSDEEFKRLRQEMITGLQAETADTHFLSTRHFYAELAGPGHPAGRFQTMRSLRNISISDVKRFNHEYILPAGCIAVLAGDWEKSMLVGIVTEQLSLWKGRPRARNAVIAPSLSLPQNTVVRLVHKPDLTQTTVALGHAAPGERCADKNALLLANHIFGGGTFSSRLMNRIRTADGKTYGVSSQLLSETDFGAFLITTSTQNRQLAGVMKSIIEEYRKFCAEGVTADELEKAKQFAIGNMAFQLEGIGNVVDKLLWLRFYGRPNSYIETFDELISSIDSAQVNNAVCRYLSPDRLVIIAVGKADEAAPQLETFGNVKKVHFRNRL
ncbi:MAG: insulinase family protein [Chitinispirillaceae bacterium]|nr:insulinase family protein [Chitinispirillaceae bacterium]